MFNLINCICLFNFIFWRVTESSLLSATLNQITEVSHFLGDVNDENFTSFIATAKKIIHIIPDYLKKMKEEDARSTHRYNDYCKSKAIRLFRNLQIDYIKLEEVCKSYTVYWQTYGALSAVIAFMNATFEETIEVCKGLDKVTPDDDIVMKRSLDKVIDEICKLLNASQPEAGDLIVSITYLRRKVDNIHDEMQRNKRINVTYLFESQKKILRPMNDLGEIKEKFNLDLIDLNRYQMDVQHIMKTWLNIYKLFNETIVSRKRYFV